MSLFEKERHARDVVVQKFRGAETKFDIRHCATTTAAFFGRLTKFSEHFASCRRSSLALLLVVVPPRQRPFVIE